MFLGIVKENICLLFNPVALSSALSAALPLCEENQNKKRKNEVHRELFQQVNWGDNILGMLQKTAQVIRTHASQGGCVMPTTGQASDGIGMRGWM